VHPDRPEVLALEQAGGLALPETELATKVWTADAAAILPALRELVGFEVVLLCCVDEHEDEAARLLRATLMAAPRAEAPPGPGARWVGRGDLAGAAFQHHQQAMVAGVLDELAGGPAGPVRAPWAARGWFQAAEGWLRGPWTSSATPRPGRCGSSRCGSCRASCGRRPPPATSGSRPPATSRCSSTRRS
jgi:hypothetical protein